MRLTGRRLPASALIATRASPSNSSSIGVSTYPGCNVLTRIGARSIASERAKASTAPHDAVATAAPRSGRRAVVPDMNVIDPVLVHLAAPYLAALNAPQKRMSIAGRSDALIRCKTRYSTSRTVLD